MTDTTNSPLVLRHNADQPEWALSTDRVLVFTTVTVEPNPDLGKPLPEQSDEPGAVPVLDERETIEVRHEWTMPAKPNPGLALQYLRLARQNADVAASWLLELAIGTDGYDALVSELVNEPDPDRAQATMQGVIQYVAKRALGGLGKA